MPALKNPRWEAFCHAIVEGMAKPGYSQAECYRSAGYHAKAGNSSEAAASRLLNKFTPVINRVRELQNQVARRRQVTKDSLVGELEEAQELAREVKQPSAIVSATGLKAKITGHLVERQETGQPGSFSNAQSAAEIVGRVLREINPGLPPLEEIPESLLKAGLAEYERHSRVLEAIASGEEQLQN
jgi:predicted trehalose synthase